MRIVGFEIDVRVPESNAAAVMLRGIAARNSLRCRSSSSPPPVERAGRRGGRRLWWRWAPKSFPAPLRTGKIRLTRARETERGVRGGCVSQPAELFYGFLDGFELFDVRVHGMLLEVEFLSELESLGGGGARNDDHTISIGDHDVRGIHRHSIANDGDVGAREAVVADGS